MMNGAMCSGKRNYWRIMHQKLLSISKAADLLGVHISTLRRWETEGKIKVIKTYGNHRRYRLIDIQKFCGEQEERQTSSDDIRVASYCRVSSHEQKQNGDLERQIGRVLTYCAKKNYHVVKAFEEVGSGMCDTRSKLQQLFKLVSEKKIDKVIVEHKDRLTRFNFEFLNQFFASHDVEIEWIDDILTKSFENELVEDMLSLISSFSSKIYGKRGAELRKQRKFLEQQKQEASC